MGIQRSAEVHGLGLDRTVHLLNDGLLVGSGRASREAVRPHLKPPRDQSKIDRDRHILHQLVI